MNNPIKAIVIAGATSGVGKTTLTTGIIGALVKRGLKVQPFKAGPDYIDPSYHTQVAGRPSRNLDTWMLPQESVIEIFNHACVDNDIAVVEGVMGLYDGHSGDNETGSTAELAKTLRLPVILVVDASRVARSIAAIALGYKQFDPALKLAGIIFNGIGSESHYQMCRDAVIQATDLAVLGYLPRRPELTLPERHLGLVPMAESPAAQDYFNELTTQIETTIDLDGALEIASGAAAPIIKPSLFPEDERPKEIRIAVAQDKAFSFYYQDNLDLLEAWGAEIIPFSPIKDNELPSDIDGIYFGGGFPEMYVEELAKNTSIMSSITEAASRGVPIYGECGGLMYLGRSLRDFEGRQHRMIGVLPIDSRLDNTRLTLGYRTIRALADGPLLKQGDEVRGHEFHRSKLDREPNEEAAYLILEQNRHEGFQFGNILASYIHVHFAAQPELAQRFIQYCKDKREN